MLQIPDDTEALAALHSVWMAAIARDDAEALRELVTDDYEAWAHETEPFRGPDAVVAAMRAALLVYRVEQRFEPVETIIAGDWAFQRGIEYIEATPRNGGPSRAQSQRALLIFHRGTDGRWRYARGMTNALPPASTPGSSA